MKLRTAVQTAGVVLAAAVVGALLTRPLLGYLIDRHAIRNGPWRTSATTGSADANPYERAAVALAGLYALTREEAIYYTAFTDSTGEPLRGECRYRVRGTPPPARWWSITVYGADHFLIPNTAGVYARNASSLPLAADGRYTLALSSTATADNGLPTPASGAFSLTLRLYNPAPEVSAQLATLALPSIEREHCP